MKKAERKTIYDFLPIIEEAYKEKQENWLTDYGRPLPDIPQELMLDVARKVYYYQHNDNEELVRSQIIYRLSVYTKAEALQSFEYVDNLIYNHNCPDMYIEFPLC